jgi:acyl-coenzyme A synthetase/AMP-(fatty) acid ligase
MGSGRGRLSLGVLFDHHADRRLPTRFHLSRPFDLAPAAGTEHGIDELAALVAEGAGWMHAAGARAGDRVAVVKDNHWDYVLLAAAAARLGAVPAMISGAMPGPPLQQVLKRLDPALLVTTAPVLDRAAEGGADLVSLATRTVSLDDPRPGALAVASLRGHPAPAPTPRRPDEPMIVTHTSGTTGTAKLVVHSADTIIGALGRTESIRWPIVSARPDDTVATSIAFCHMRIITWTTGMLQLGPAAAVLVADAEPEVAERVLTAHPPTYLEALPATYIRWEPLTERRPSVFARVRLYVSTFDAMHPPTMRRFLAASQRRYPFWLQGWGQSEAGPMTFRLFHRLALVRRGSRHPTTRNVGRPIPTIMGLRVVDRQTMRRVRPGEPGILMARTRGRCLSYVGEEDRWRMKAQGAWWNTGDVGVRTLTGAFRLLDREVDLIPGMSCIELEDILADRLPWVLEAVVLGEPGRRPLPVLCSDDGRFDPAAWREASRDLPAMEEPVVLTWAQMPRTGTGKVRRLELRERLGRGETYGTGRWT